MQKYLFVYWFSGFLLLGACQEAQNNQVKAASSRYFDVPAFIRRQVALLNSQKPVAVKSVMESNQIAESKTINNPNWSKELESFAELDLNRPAYRNAYNITRQVDSAGRVTEIYRKKPDTEGNIQLLAVTTDQSKKVFAIRAIRKSENLLLSNQTELEFFTDTKSGDNRVRSFKISGQQKPIFFDTLHYVIMTQIR